MPNIEYFKAPERPTHRYRVKATGETGSALSGAHSSRVVGRLVTIGPDLNVRVIDLCHDSSGEIRTYREEFLEVIAVEDKTKQARG
jgi:hypothetical protein